MINRWNEHEAAQFANDPVALRVYTSRLLGADADLVLHGGGNTSVKVDGILYVKGSGWDLASIEKPGFPAVKLAPLLELADRETLTDTEMVAAQKAAMLDKSAPNPSVEAILHALIPFDYVDHTHADAVAALSAAPEGEKHLRAVFGPKVLIVPYVMPGFILAKTIRDLTRSIDWNDLEGVVLLNHGLFTFADSAKTAYDKMIELSAKAETYLNEKALLTLPKPLPENSSLAERVRLAAGENFAVKPLLTPEAAALCALPNAEKIAKGCLTPEHVLRTKRLYLVCDESRIESSFAAYRREYDAYFARHATDQIKLDSTPRVVVIKNKGVFALSPDAKGLKPVADIAEHTIRAILQAEKLGGWQPLGEKELFEIEYWELEQAKLRKTA
ncbi:MAG: class II aldolase/adducin family protein [Campylobacterales bacterium]